MVGGFICGRVWRACFGEWGVVEELREIVKKVTLWLGFWEGRDFSVLVSVDIFEVFVRGG